ncbi:MAG: hypothetical protein WDZ77_01025 [Candidatus Pacearchaeota archaeon]
MNNKKGADRIISVYWFVILIIVAGSVVYMVSAFYGVPYDVKPIEADLMINQVATCLSEDGRLKYNLDENLEGNFLEICHFNFEDGDPDGSYYLVVSFYAFESRNPINFEITKGNSNLGLVYETTSSGEIASANKSFYTLNGNQEIVVNIFALVSERK